MKIERIDDIYPYATQILDEFIKKQRFYHSDYVFEVSYRRKGETDFTKSYELCDYIPGSSGGSLDWHTDWYIGQDEIVFGRVVPLYDIINSYFEALDREDGKP